MNIDILTGTAKGYQNITEGVDTNVGDNLNDSGENAIKEMPLHRDVEGALEQFVTMLQEEGKTAETISHIRKKLVEMDGRKVIKKMEERAKHVLNSGIFQGIVSIGSAIATAVTAGAGLGVAAGASSAGAATGTGASAGGSVGAQAGTTGASSGACVCTESVATSTATVSKIANSVAGSATQKIGSNLMKNVAIKASPELIRAIGSADGWRFEAEKKDVERQKATEKKQIDEMDYNDSHSRLERTRQERHRAVQTIEKIEQLKEDGLKIATNSLRA